jgi:hypothetical protein
MKKTIFREKYPVYTLEIYKNETTYKTVQEIIAYLKNIIDNHKIAQFISIFDNYAHTLSLDGEINPNIKGATNIIFCFGLAIPNTKILAIRPRSIGVVELENSFAIEFLEAPKEELNNMMENWAKLIKNK